MDKEDCIQVLLLALEQPEWKNTTSVTDWDLKNVLWKAGLLLTPEQVAALFADIRRRGLVSGSERRSEGHIVALWGVKITPAGVEWLAQHSQAAGRSGAPSTASGTPSSVQQVGSAGGDSEQEYLSEPPSPESDPAISPS